MAERTEKCHPTTFSRWLRSAFRPRLGASLSAVAAFSALSALSVPLPAQTNRVTGLVIAADSTPAPGVRVVLHQVGRETQGPIDSTRSDRRGRFLFAFRADTSAFYLVSGRYAGIEYFSSPLSTNPAVPDTAIRVVVYDTSSSAAVALEARHLLLTRAGEDGSRSVLDLIILHNAGRVTRVAPDTLRGSWSVPLPRGTAGLQVRESDISAEAVSRTGDSLIIAAALAPGEKQLTLQYEVPAGRDVVELPVERGLPLNVLTEEPAVRVSGPGLTRADSQVIQGRSFRRWTGTTPSSGLLRLIIPGSPRAPSWLLAALVLGMAIGLLGIGWYALAARRTTTVPVPDAMLDAIAALDARYLGRQDETPEAEWDSYQAERARLKSEVEASLAGGGRDR